MFIVIITVYVYIVREVASRLFLSPNMRTINEFGLDAATGGGMTSPQQCDGRLALCQLDVLNKVRVIVLSTVYVSII